MALDYAGRRLAKEQLVRLSEKLQNVDLELKAKMQQLRLKVYVEEVQAFLPQDVGELSGEPFNFKKKSDIKTLLQAIESGIMK